MLSSTTNSARATPYVPREAPNVFEIRDDDFLYVLQEEPGENLRARVEAAAAVCPKQAIAIED